MRELTLSEINSVAGGDAMTREWGQMLGTAISEMASHPEAAFLGPVFGTIYLATRH